MKCIRFNRRIRVAVGLAVIAISSVCSVGAQSKPASAGIHDPVVITPAPIAVIKSVPSGAAMPIVTGKLAAVKKKTHRTRAAKHSRRATYKAHSLGSHDPVILYVPNTGPTSSTTAGITLVTWMVNVRTLGDLASGFNGYALMTPYLINAAGAAVATGAGTGLPTAAPLTLQFSNSYAYFPVTAQVTGQYFEVYLEVVPNDDDIYPGQLTLYMGPNGPITAKEYFIQLASGQTGQ